MEAENVYGEGRRVRLAVSRVGSANAALANDEVPPNVLNATGANGNAGTFGFNHWQMNVHTEQWYQMAQMRAGLGDSSAPQVRQ